MVSSVQLPTGSQAFFHNDSSVQLDGSAGITLSSNSRRHTVVVDADGHQTDYRWGSPSVMLQDVPAVVAAQSPNNLGELVAWGNLTMTYQDSTGTNLGSETFAFDPAAGMALLNATDFSGHTTSYDHIGTGNINVWTAPSTAFTRMLPGLYDVASTGFFGYYDDPVAQTNAVGDTKAFTYNGLRLMSDVVDEKGHLTHYEFDNGATTPTLGLRTKEQHYDSNSTSGNLLSETDYTYGNTSFPSVVTQMTVKPVGTTDPSWAGNMSVQYVLDAHGRVAQKIADPGNLSLTTSYTYSNGGDKLTETDPNGHLTCFTYDGRHRLTSVLYPDGNQRLYEYDLRGNLLTETDELTHATIKSYDALNRVTSVERDMVHDTSNASYNTSGNLVTAFTYSETGAKLSSTDANGNAVSYHYDALNRLVEMDSPAVAVNGNTTAAPLVTTFTYGNNSGGNAFDASSFKPTSTTDPRGYTTTVAYDSLYRPVTESVQYAQASGNTSAAYANTTKTYDAAGNLLTVTDPLGNTTTTTYDALNRPNLVTYADGTNSTVKYTSTGLAYFKTDELGRQSQTDFDSAGRAVAVHQPDPATGTITGNSPTVHTDYDANGNPVHVTNPLGQVWTYLYDARNRKIAEISPSAEDWSAGTGSGNFVSPTVRTEYDPAGNVQSVTDARGNKTVMFYDAANRPTLTITPQADYIGANGTLVTGQYLASARGYDRNGNVLTTRAGTAPASANTGLSLTRVTATNTYDALNRLLTTTDAANITVSNVYDEAGNRVHLIDGRGVDNHFAYDGLNRVVRASSPGWPGSITDLGTVIYIYDAVNKVSRIDANSAGPKTDYTYDARNRLTGVIYPGRFATYNGYAIDPNGGVAGTRSYSYDAAGELLAVQETGQYGGNATNVAYAYDQLGRVVLEAQGVAINGTVSANGTNLPAGISGGFVNQYAYDTAGNRISAVYGVGRSDLRTLTSTYDSLNRLITVKVDAGRTTTYHYDAAGN